MGYSGDFAGVIGQKTQNFPVFSLLNRELGREGFAGDSLHRQTVVPRKNWIPNKFKTFGV
jgi:hypothetical protein